MKISINWTDKIATGPRRNAFHTFTQRMANRLIQGACRYGQVSKEHHYLTRLVMEVKAYKRTGNVEHLYNAANYCVLETLAPENEKFHWDSAADSATRGKV